MGHRLHHSAEQVSPVLLQPGAISGAVIRMEPGVKDGMQI